MKPMQRLIGIMAKLRSPHGGCPWDCAQTFETVAPYTLEEAYEVDDAIRRADLHDLRDELGDLLFQVVFHAQMASERGVFDFDDVAAGICDKLERRHPHVFGDVEHASSEALGDAWEQAKARERHDRATDRGARPPGVFDGIPAALPALTRAAKLQKRAEREWPERKLEPEACLDNARAALSMLIASLDLAVEQARGSRERSQHAVGELLFEVVRLARHLGVNPEAALQATNAAFEDAS